MKLNKISVEHKKGTQNCETAQLAVPKTVTLPLCQHMGALCDPLVKVGDEVKVGTKIGDTDAFMSTPMHSSVSGKVTAINEFLLANGRVCKAIVIDSDGLQTVDESIKPPLVTDKASLVSAVKESGCCGLGGAGFPTHIKLNFDKAKNPVDSLVINAAECEPFITSDYRELIESPQDVIDGVKLLLKLLEIPKAYICIEDNKPKAISLMKEMKNDDSIEVVTLKSSYPQGAEKIIAFSATGRIIAEGELPLNKGIIVMNVSTVGFINRYIKTGMPLVSRRITVDGDICKNPANLLVPIGTPVSELLSFAQADVEIADKILSGGPMMGMCLIDLDAPIVKTNNAILAFSKQPVPVQTACIRCGKCIKACPMSLMPTDLEKAFDAGDADALKALKLSLCMNCGSCSYVCPAKRNLAEKNQLAKALIAPKR